MFERRRPSERDIDDEIAFHLAEEARLREADGASPVEARAAATRAFGNVTLVRGVTRDAWGRRVLSTVGQDLRLGVRLLRRHAGFALFSIVSLALGIGGTSAIFSLYDAIVLRALPVPSPGRLVVLSIQTGEQSNSFMPFPQFEAMRDGTQTLTGLFARTRLPTVSVASRGVAEVSSVTAVSGGYHATLGVLPATGRLLGPEDDRPGGAAAAVISHAYWRRRFAGDAGVLGATISLNQVPFTIVGVEPAGFHGVTVGQAPDVTIPIRALTRLSPKPPPFDHAFATWIEVMGRLRDGVPLERAGQELDARFRQASDAAAGASGKEGDSRFARETHLRVASGTTGGFSGVRERYAQGLRLLLSLLAGVLLLATLNVAALLLSRAEVRRQELATRLALGAGRGRLVRQLLTEAAVIALCGGALGLGLAWQGSAVLVRMLLPPAPGFGLDVTPDLRVVIFTALVSMAGCLAFGLLPALRSTRSLRRESRAEVGGPSRRLLD